MIPITNFKANPDVYRELYAPLYSKPITAADMVQFSFQAASELIHRAQPSSDQSTATHTVGHMLSWKQLQYNQLQTWSVLLFSSWSS